MPNEIKVIATKLASEFKPKEAEFLWFPYLPRKTLTVIQGDSGYGKSSFLLNIAARLSRSHTHRPNANSVNR
jgi:ABC-type transport system involved in cytochrome bd biosynthesis fused ATPase/permease subunit